MAATDIIYSNIGIPNGDEPYTNSSGSAITAGWALKIDTTNPEGLTSPTLKLIPTTAVTDRIYGFALENVAAGSQGRVRTMGRVVGIAAGAITVGATVGASTTTGLVTAYTATDPYGGIACSAAANANDPIDIKVQPGLTA